MAIGRDWQKPSISWPSTLSWSMPRTGGDGSVCPAGQGIVEFVPFLGRLQRAGYDGPLVVHGIEEAEVPAAVSYLRSTLETLSRRSSHALY